MKSKNWYSKNTGSDQALIIDEKTGESIAVSYRPENGPLLAAAPVLLAICKVILKSDGGAYDLEPYQSEMLMEAISKAEGR